MLYNLLLVAHLFLSSTGSKPPKTYPVGQIKTRLGEVLFWLYDETPRHKASFLKLANAAYWDTLTFNRVIPNFVAQGGCPDTPPGLPVRLTYSNLSLYRPFGTYTGRSGPGATITPASCRRVANCTSCRTKKAFPD